MTHEEIVKRTTKLIGDEFARTPPADRQELLSAFATTALVLLHGTYGREWVLGYLRGATEDLGREDVVHIGIATMTPQ